MILEMTSRRKNRIEKAKIKAYGGFGDTLVYETEVKWNNGLNQRLFLPVLEFKEMGVLKRLKTGKSVKVEQWLNTNEGNQYIQTFIRNKGTGYNLFLNC